MGRSIQFGEKTYPNRQRLLRIVKGQPTQRRWIVLVAHDDSFDLAIMIFEDGALRRSGAGLEGSPYDALWSELYAQDCGDHKTWLIGWRVRYAMERAGFVDALGSGEVKLPRIKVGRNRGKHGGKLTWNKRILEVDLVCGENRIKMLDWSNFGVDPAAYVARLGDVTLDVAEQALQDFLGLTQAIGVSVCKSTAAQLGWDHARRSCVTAPLHVNLDTPSRELERRAYFGGRCEAFRLGDIPGTTYSLDVRSCYASICGNCDLPFRCVEEYKAGLDVSAIPVYDTHHWIADVVLKTDSADYPLRWGDKPIYPVGEFATSLAWPELCHALKLRRVKKIVRAARYEAGPVLRDYATWYANARAAADSLGMKGLSGVVKGVFNASLGYTARSKYEWQPWLCQLGCRYWLGTTNHPEEKGQAVAAQVLDGEKRWLKIAGEPYEAIPYLHATICSYARVKLLEIFDFAGRENVLYCDTDGVLLTQGGKEALERQPGLLGVNPGQLVERFPPGDARINGQKTYRVGRHWIQAGHAKTRYSCLARKRVLTSETGRTNTDGTVTPFRFLYDDDEGLSWQARNVMA